MLPTRAVGYDCFMWQVRAVLRNWDLRQALILVRHVLYEAPILFANRPFPRAIVHIIISLSHMFIYRVHIPHLFVSSTCPGYRSCVVSSLLDIRPRSEVEMGETLAGNGNA